MDFALDKKHEMARTLFREFAEKEVKPLAQEVDETRSISQSYCGKNGKICFLEFRYPRSTADRAVIP